MVWIPEAVIRHAHPLTPGTFWAQHLGYGRGARRFQQARWRRGGKSVIEPAFYWTLLCRLPRALAGHRMPFSMAALLAVWQAANACGWLLEAFRASGGGERRD
jgi:hypothetical protein